MRGLGPRRLVLGLDACHQGVRLLRDSPFKKGPLAGPGSDPNQPPAPDVPLISLDPEWVMSAARELAEGFALFAGTSAGQIAQHDHTVEHGAFTWMVDSALRGAADWNKDGVITVDDMKDYVVAGMRAWYTQKGKDCQLPTTRIEGCGDMVLVRRS